MSKVQVDTIDTRSGTSTMQIGSTNTSTINIGVSGDTVNIPSGVTIANAGTATGFAENNKPRFYAYRNGAQSIANNTYTVIQFNAENFDSDSKFDTSTYRFTPTVAGFYFLHVNASTDNESSSNTHMTIRKNGSAIARNKVQNTNRNSIGVSIIVESDTNDYFDAEIMQDSGGGRNILSGSEYTWFTGFKLT